MVTRSFFGETLHSILFVLIYTLVSNAHPCSPTNPHATWKIGQGKHLSAVSENSGNSFSFDHREGKILGWGYLQCVGE
ncbi:hypothetical protein DID88_005751 [Monilinia fructigena]|uniref:Uncharacterized protein n=1 Tax=Monilinia fructigena TaxID=38457 RepID=A0A395J0S9_9HELO|nr:hypothetical protein DID88_005751 [Monilinia fructigena]